MADAIAYRRGWGPLELKGMDDSIGGPAAPNEVPEELRALFDKLPSIRTIVIVYDDGWDTYDRAKEA